MRTYHVVSLCVAVFAAVISALLFRTHQQGSPAQTSDLFDAEKVLALARSLTSRSWEFGTLVQALLEFHDPELTVFARDPFPEGRILVVDEPASVEGLAFAKSLIWTNGSEVLIDGEGKLSTPRTRFSDLRSFWRGSYEFEQAHPRILLRLGPLPCFSHITIEPTCTRPDDRQSMWSTGRHGSESTRPMLPSLIETRLPSSGATLSTWYPRFSRTMA